MCINLLSISTPIHTARAPTTRLSPELINLIAYPLMEHYMSAVSAAYRTGSGSHSPAAINSHSATLISRVLSISRVCQLAASTATTFLLLAFSMGFFVCRQRKTAKKKARKKKNIFSSCDLRLHVCVQQKKCPIKNEFRKQQ